MSEINLSGLDGLSITGSSYPTTTTTSAGGWLSDMWGGVKSFLQDGIDVAGDLAGIKAAWEGTNSNSAFTSQYQPTDEQQLANLNSQARAELAAGQWVSGIPNTAVLLGGAAVLIGVLALVGGRR